MTRTWEGWTEPGEEVVEMHEVTEHVFVGKDQTDDPDQLVYDPSSPSGTSRRSEWEAKTPEERAVVRFGPIFVDCRVASRVEE